MDGGKGEEKWEGGRGEGRAGKLSLWLWGGTKERDGQTDRVILERVGVGTAGQTDRRGDVGVINGYGDGQTDGQRYGDEWV